MNQFQLILTKELIELLSPSALGNFLINVSKGPNEVTIECKLVSQDIAFWIYEDEASVLGMILIFASRLRASGAGRR
jgi:hypothetical protein